MVNRFPLLRLPFLCILEVISNMKLGQRIKTSLTSKRMYRYIQLTRIPNAQMDIRIDQEKTSVLLWSNSIMFGRWFFPSRKTTKWREQRIEARNREPLNIGGVLMHFGKSETDFNLDSYPPLDFIGEIAEKGIEYIQNLLNASIYTVGLQVRKVAESRLPHNIGINRCQRLYIASDKPMKDRLLREMLCEIEIENSFVCILPLNSGLPFDPMHLKATQLLCLCDRSSWISRDVLLSFKFDTIRCESNFGSLNSDDLNDLIHHWYYSTNKSFKQFGIPIWGYIPSFLDDIPSMKWDPKKREQFFIIDNFRQIDCSNGVDIERSDGLLATVLYRESYFWFFIWHQTFH